jgi:branched-chain amino acid transport system ATP-binding protein
MSKLKIKNFYKHFGGVKAVNGLDLEIPEGKITGLVGPNGSGKSTLINLITGVTPKDKGTMVISEHFKTDKIQPQDMYEYKITRTFQNVRVFEQMSVLDNLLVVLTHRNAVGALFEKKKKLYEDRAMSILDKIGLHDKRDELAMNLSYGQRKLLEIGRVLAMDSEIILFDEPYAGLFPEMIKKVSEIIKELRLAGKTIILVEHNMQIIRELCDHVVVLDAGEWLAEGTPEKVLSQKNVIEAYLGE